MSTFGGFCGTLRQRLTAVQGAGQPVLPQCFLVDFVLEIIVFNDQDVAVGS